MDGYTGECEERRVFMVMLRGERWRKGIYLTLKLKQKMNNCNNNHKITININETSCRSFCTTITNQNFVTFSTKQSNIQCKYSAQTGLCELKIAQRYILYNSTLPVPMYTTETCGNAAVLHNNVLIPLT